MGFNAQEAVPKLDFDFRPYVKVHGTSPEPSIEALTEFNTQVRALYDGIIRTKKALAVKEMERAEGASKEEKQAEVEKWAAMDWEEGAQHSLNMLAELSPGKEVLDVAKRQAELIGEVFQNIPSVEEILALPGRVQAAYYGWVIGQLMSPESEAAVTS